MLFTAGVVNLRFLFIMQEANWKKGNLVGLVAKWSVHACGSRGGRSTPLLLLRGKVGSELLPHLLLSQEKLKIDALCLLSQFFKNVSN